MVNKIMKLKIKDGTFGKVEEPMVAILNKSDIVDHFGIYKLIPWEWTQVPKSLADRLVKEENSHWVIGDDAVAILNPKDANMLMREPTTIIISSYRHFELTKAALESILIYPTVKDDEIIISDDGSDVQTLNAIEKLIHNTGHKEIRLLRNKRRTNPGLARCRQAARDAAKHDWVLWMDNDVTWKWSDPIKSLQIAWRKAPNVGAAMPIRILPNSRAFGAMKHDRNLRSSPIPLREGLTSMYPEGACFLSHKSTFHLWRFDGELDCFEDVDIGFQMYHVGLQIICAENARVFHNLGQSGLWKYAEEHAFVREIIKDRWEDEIYRRFGP